MSAQAKPRMMLPSPTSPQSLSNPPSSPTEEGTGFPCPNKQCQLRFPSFEALTHHLHLSTHAISSIKCPVCQNATPVRFLLHHLQAIVDDRHAGFVSRLGDFDNYLYKYLLMVNGSDLLNPPTTTTQAHSVPTTVSLQGTTPTVAVQAAPCVQIPSPAPSEGAQATMMTPMRRSSSNNTAQLNQGALAGQKRNAATAFQTNGVSQYPAAPGKTAQISAQGRQSQLHDTYNRFLDIFNQGMGQLRQSETCRLATLSEATHYEDHGFLIFHQILCLEVHEPQTTKNVLSYSMPARRGLMEVDKLLNSQDTVRPYFFQFWSRFPGDIKALLVSNALYKQIVPLMMTMCEHFERGFAPLKARCVARQYPPSAGELATQLQVTSAVLQRVIFHSIAQSTWPGSSYNTLRSALVIFQAEDQKVWGRLSAESRREQYSDLHMVALWQQLRRCPEYLNPNPQSNPTPTTLKPSRVPQPPRILTSNTQNLSQVNITPSHPGQAQSRPLNRANQASQAHNLNGLTIQQPQGFPASSMPTPSTPGQLISPLNHVNLGRGLPSPNQVISLSTQPPQVAAVNVTPQVAPTNINKANNIRVPPPRSPHLVAIDAQEKMFQRTCGFALGPTDIDCSLTNQSWRFDLADEHFRALPQDVAGDEPNSKPKRLLQPKSATYRLRCTDGASTNDINEWVCRDISWPFGFTFKLNGRVLQTRMKPNCGRGLPIDLTRALYSGANTFEVLVPPSFRQKQKIRCFAIERAALMSRSEIVEKVTNTIVPAGEVISVIRRALAPSTTDDASDDLQCLSTSVSISLMDPIMAISIWETPVRTRTCKHREAFDLDTFLTTRCDARATNDTPSSADVWFCPICSADARPDELQVDGFLADVRRVLKQQGRLGTAKIVEVDEDGMWNARGEKVEPGSPSVPSSPEPIRNDGKMTLPPPPKPQKATVEIVDLTD